MTWRPLNNPIIIGLPDLSADLFALIVQLRAHAPRADAASLRTSILDMLRAFARNGADQGVASSDVQDAEFALVATIDEMLLTSDWKHRAEWKSLAEQRFKEPNAGEVFYDRMQAIERSSNARRRELVEVYATCIYLGFRGMYAGGDRDELRRILGSAAALIAGDGSGDALAANVRPSESVQAKIKRLPIWTWVAVGLMLVVLANLWLGREGNRRVNDSVSAVQKMAVQKMSDGAAGEPK